MHDAHAARATSSHAEDEHVHGGFPRCVWRRQLRLREGHWRHLGDEGCPWKPTQECAWRGVYWCRQTGTNGTELKGPRAGGLSCLSKLGSRLACFLAFFLGCVHVCGVTSFRCSIGLYECVQYSISHFLGRFTFSLPAYCVVEDSTARVDGHCCCCYYCYRRCRSITFCIDTADSIRWIELDSGERGPFFLLLVLVLFRWQQHQYRRVPTVTMRVRVRVRGFDSLALAADECLLPRGCRQVSGRHFGSGPLVLRIGALCVYDIVNRRLVFRGVVGGSRCGPTWAPAAPVRNPHLRRAAPRSLAAVRKRETGTERGGSEASPDWLLGARHGVIRADCWALRPRCPELPRVRMPPQHARKTPAASCATLVFPRALQSISHGMRGARIRAALHDGDGARIQPALLRTVCISLVRLDARGDYLGR